MIAASPPAPSAVREAPVYLVAGAVFLATAGLTLYFARAMAGGMPMPGGWTMSMMWMVMPGQTRLSAALVFIAMWAAMMVAMMLPSTLPLLLLYRRAVLVRGDARPALATALLAVAYFFVWTLFGVVAYLAGSAMARFAMGYAAAARAVPLLTGAALLLAGLYQLTPWKYACLRHCRDFLLLITHHIGEGWRGALRLGLYHGAFCAACCWALMLIQLVVGVMSVPAMVAVATVIAIEKLLRRGEWVARVLGLAALAAGAGVLLRHLR